MAVYSPAASTRVHERDGVCVSDHSNGDTQSRNCSRSPARTRLAIDSRPVSSKLSKAAILSTSPKQGWAPRPYRVFERLIPDQLISGDFSPSTIFFAAWSILQASRTGSDDVNFATVGETLCQTGDASLSSSAGAPAVVPVHVSLNKKFSVSELLHHVQLCLTSEESRSGHVDGRTKTTKPATNQTRDFQTLIIVDQGFQSTKEPDCLQRDTLEPNGARDVFPKQDQYPHVGLIAKCVVETGCIHVAFKFDPLVISSATMTRIPQQLEHILRLICDPNGRESLLCDLQIASHEDLEDVWKWNDEVPNAVRKCVHEIIDDSILKSAPKTAIDAWDGMLTYDQLGVYSTRLACYLAHQGLVPGSPVLLCFSKSKWAPVAMLAVMKAGGVTTTTDVTQPDERLRNIAHQVKPALILTLQSDATTARSLFDSPVVIVDDDDHLDCLLRALTDVQLPTVNPSSLLYTVFTSGSTGSPKGVMITHQNFSTCIKYQQAALGFKEHSRVLDFASFAFDVSWSNMILTFCAGGCLCIPAASEVRDDLVGTMNRYRVTHAELTPTVSSTIAPERLASLESLIFSGETLDPSTSGRWPESVLLLNGYGPAECTVTATVTGADLREAPQGTIGHGVGLCTWVVEPEAGKRLVPIHSIGELWLEGPLVGPGYLNNSRMTAASFVEDPPWLLAGSPGRPGRRGTLYKTGDLVQYNADGTILFVGRKDTQVKIRGQRVELSEIEHCITRLLTERPSETVSSSSIQVVAEVLNTDEHRQILCAFVHVKDARDRARVLELLSHHHETPIKARVEKHLPSYMVPQRFISVDSLPQTSAGKVDRKQLRATWAGAVGSASDRAPEAGDPAKVQTKMQKEMQLLWANALAISSDKIRLEDSFIGLGGNSVDTMKLTGAAREKGIELTVCDVLNHPQLRELAGLVDRAADNPVVGVGRVGA